MEPLRVLLMFPRSLWEHKMSMVRRHAMEALIVRPDVKCRLTGQNWPDYDNGKPLRDNLRKIYPDAQVIFWYKPLGDDPVKLIEPGVRDIPACASYNECWWPGWLALREVQDSRNELVVCHHQEDIKQFDGPGWRPKVVHIPHAARAEIFHKAALPWGRRNVQALLTGAVSADTYPLRDKIREGIKRGQIPGVIRQHPSYLLKSLEACNKQADDYAAQLGRAKAVYLCGSIYNYGLAKYAESALAGACLLGDSPPDYAQTLGPHIIQLDRHQPAEAFAAYIKKRLSNENDLRDRAHAVQQAALAHHTMDKYLDTLVGHLRQLVQDFGGTSA